MNDTHTKNQCWKNNQFMVPVSGTCDMGSSSSSSRRVFIYMARLKQKSLCTWVFSSRRNVASSMSVWRSSAGKVFQNRGPKLRVLLDCVLVLCILLIGWWQNAFVALTFGRIVSVWIWKALSMLLWWSLLVVNSPKYPVCMKSFGLSGQDEVSLLFPVGREAEQSLSSLRSSQEASWVIWELKVGSCCLPNLVLSWIL